MSDREGNMGQSAPSAPSARGGRPPRLNVSSLADGREGDERDLNEREVTENREIADDIRLELFRDSMHQSVLPDLPHMPGYHVCWLTTSNARDSIQHRLRIGYELIRVEQCPEWDGVTTRVPGYDGVIGINEMVAARIPLRLYNQFMVHVHHDSPLAEEEKLKAQVERAADELEAAGSGLVEVGDGTASMVQKAAPKFGLTS